MPYVSSQRSDVVILKRESIVIPTVLQWAACNPNIFSCLYSCAGGVTYTVVAIGSCLCWSDATVTGVGVGITVFLGTMNDCEPDVVH